MIAAKRDGARLDDEQIARFVAEIGAGEIGDGPAAAFLMAALLRGLDAGETLSMTRAMIASGDTVSLPDVGMPTVDKHSTGGVADGVTLAFAPLAAALGLGVAKLSGRGLGHTGGTLDKLESIPGLRTDLSPERLAAQVAEVGCAVAAQSPSLVPADGVLYALRDATATVPSVPLIAASVMAKKLAVRTDLILLDVKAGSGAFMRTPEDARSLADACVELARGEGRACGVAVTDMSQPLGDAVGNALDVVGGRGAPPRRSPGQAPGAGRVVRGSGARAHGAASPRRMHAPARNVRSRTARRLSVSARWWRRRAATARSSTTRSASCRRRPCRSRSRCPGRGSSGRWTPPRSAAASGALGAGRRRMGDPIDPSVGIVLPVKIGDRVEAGQDVGTIHARDEASAEAAASAVRGADRARRRPGPAAPARARVDPTEGGLSGQLHGPWPARRRRDARGAVRGDEPA